MMGVYDPVYVAAGVPPIVLLDTRGDLSDCVTIRWSRRAP
jgi:hypothetical protein